MQLLPEDLCESLCSVGLKLEHGELTSTCKATAFHARVFFLSPCKSVMPLPLPKVSPYLLSLLFPALLWEPENLGT